MSSVYPGQSGGQPDPNSHQPGPNGYQPGSNSHPQWPNGPQSGPNSYPQGANGYPQHGHPPAYNGPHQNPHPGYPVPPQGQPGQYPAAPQEQKKGGCLKWGLIIGGILLLLLIIAAMMGDSKDTEPTTSGSSDQTVQSDDQPEEDANDGANTDNANGSNQDAELAFGEEADLKGLKVTAANLRDDGTDVLGNTHVCSDVSVMNESDKSVHVDQFDFKLTTPAGITVDSTFTGSGDLQTADVNQGGNLSGVVCFESDAAPGDYKLGYEPLFSTRKAYWNGQL